MQDLELAFIWHQHQPYYPDDVAETTLMPWVRLHGSKDYWGMAMHLHEIPEMHCTINLVPSLLSQIIAYTDQGRQDVHLRVSRAPADSLAEEDMEYLLDNFFMVHADQMIRPYPRYLELFEQRGLGVDPASRAAKRFAPRDVLDLQCWNNLAWIHPLAFELDKDLADFRAKGGRWTESEKQWLLDKQMELLRQIIPLHRKLMERGQLELTTTPFYHPILPLLHDKLLARQAMPHVNLPTHLKGYAEDAAKHLERAVAYHEKLFGQKPRGLWPSEGSVAQEVVAAIADAGIEWIATDEEVLAASTQGLVARDGQGYLRRPEMLYRPWVVEEGGKRLQMVFRDHAMSDQIGFHYQRYGATQAADDFIGKLEAIGRATADKMDARPPLVSIILDGENCWEYYHNGGVEFLRTLYRRIVDHPRIRPTRVSDYLDRHPAREKIGRLFAGSWISHNFGIWIGHPECNRAWDLLFETREFLKQTESAGLKPSALVSRAWEELFVAEGSDWFWWFGDSHSSAQDGLFDRLFRKHLTNVYLCLGEEPPADLAQPISQAREHQERHTQPTGLLSVRINGRQTYFEWLNAGKYFASGSRGTMSMVDKRVVEQISFGFDKHRLLLRVDVRGGSVREQLAQVDSLRIAFVEPAGFELLIAGPGSAEPIVQLYHNDVPVSAAGVQASADAILEVAIPWRSLAVTTGSPLKFYVDLIENERSTERTPSEGAIESLVPEPHYELMMWQA